MSASPAIDGARPGVRPGVLLLRHAMAVRRRAWSGEHRLRPLDDQGRQQADALPAHLAANDLVPVHLVAGPAVRCRATLEPLAVATGLEVEIDDRFAEYTPPLNGDDGWGDPAWLAGRALAGLDAAVDRVVRGRGGTTDPAPVAPASMSPTTAPLEVVVVCSHGEVLPALLAALGGRDGWDLTRGPDLTRKAMPKGAGWLLAADGSVLVVDPPAVPDPRGSVLP